MIFCQNYTYFTGLILIYERIKNEKIAYLASAVLAGLGFSTVAKADVSASGSYASIIEGSATTTEFMTGGVSFAMSTTTAGGILYQLLVVSHLTVTMLITLKVFQVLTQ